MSTWFLVVTILFIIVSAVMVLVILVQRPQGGGLAGAFGGAAGGGTDTVFGGRVGDALTVMTVVAFSAYLLLAIGLNVMDVKPSSTVAATMPATAGTNEPATDPSAPISPATPSSVIPLNTDNAPPPEADEDGTADSADQE